MSILRTLGTARAVHPMLIAVANLLRKENVIHCNECGANPLGADTCLDRFHTLLAAEAHNAELRQMHGLTVLTYHLQHPSLTKPWYQIFGAEAMHRIFDLGEDWHDVLMAEHPHRIGRKRSDVAITRRKAAGGITMPDWVVTHPIPGELDVTSIDPSAPAGQAEQVLAWARSVAEHRVPPRRPV